MKAIVIEYEQKDASNQWGRTEMNCQSFMGLLFRSPHMKSPLQTMVTVCVSLTAFSIGLSTQASAQIAILIEGTPGSPIISVEAQGSFLSPRFGSSMLNNNYIGNLAQWSGDFLNVDINNDPGLGINNPAPVISGDLRAVNTETGEVVPLMLSLDDDGNGSASGAGFIDDFGLFRVDGERFVYDREIWEVLGRSTFDLRELGRLEPELIETVNFNDLNVGVYTGTYEGNDLTLTIRVATPPVEIVEVSFSPADGNTSLTWTSIPDVSYAVFVSSDLSTFVEVEVGADGVTSQGTETTFEFADSLSEETGRRFFQVKEILEGS